jgi:hypothetical protein
LLLHEMKYKDLTRTHHDFKPDVLRQYRDLVEGGERFLSRVHLYLPKHDVEMADTYRKRCANAHYLGYCGRIVNYFASWLFTRPPTYQSDPVNRGDWWNGWLRDVDDDGTTLEQSAHNLLSDALIDRCAYWKVVFPENLPADTLKDWEANGNGRAVLQPLRACHLTNWRCDELGNWLWVVEHDKRTELEEFDRADETVTETWTLWKRDGQHRRWSIAYNKTKPPQSNQEIPEVDPPEFPIPTIPIVGLELPMPMWAMNHLASAQLEHFRQRNANSWAIQRTCYTTPVFNLESPREPTLGAGRYLMLRVGESLSYPAPPSTPFQIVGDEAQKLVEEIHRVADQMAAGISNNAAAIGRSGDSKEADMMATAVVLAALGDRARKPILDVLDLVARARGESITWTVGGLSGYDQAFTKSQARELLSDTKQIEDMNIPSATLKETVVVRAALAQVPEVDDTTKQRIKQEIVDGLEKQVAEKQAMRDAMQKNLTGKPTEPAGESEENETESETETETKPGSIPPPKPTA